MIAVAAIQSVGAGAAASVLDAPGRLPAAIEIAGALTLLSILPAILVSVTCFTRIVIVLSFVRRALALQELPPNQVVVGLALFLTLFVMWPVAVQVHTTSVAPYLEGKTSVKEAGVSAAEILQTFLLKHTRPADLALFTEAARIEAPPSPQALPIRVVIPAFLLSELKTAFQMGFVVFLPFLVIDLVVSAVLLAMGMFMLPPTMISTPLKVLLFVLVDGWNLVVRSLLTSVAAP